MKNFKIIYTYTFLGAEIVGIKLKIMSTAETKQEKQSINLKDIIGMIVMSLEWGVDVVIVLEGFLGPYMA